MTDEAASCVDTYYVVRFNFKHDIRYSCVRGKFRGRAGETKFLKSFEDGFGAEFAFWKMCDDRRYAFRFPSVKSARGAAKQLSREDYGGGRCCERVIERVTEEVVRYSGVKPPPADKMIKGKWAKICKQCK